MIRKIVPKYLRRQYRHEDSHRVAWEADVCHKDLEPGQFATKQIGIIQ